MGDFLQELLRRKVLRVVAAYVVASWVLLQVADLLASVLELPDWTAKLVFLILVVGFVPALILAWAYDLTPDGIRVTADKDGTAAVSGKAPVAIVIGFVVAGLALGAGWYTGKDARWARDEGMPAIEAFVTTGDRESAYAVALRVETAIPEDPDMAQIWKTFSWRTSILSSPPGATVFRRAYARPNAEWQALGVTPLYDIHVPFGASLLRLEAADHPALLRVIGGGMGSTVDLPVQEQPTADFLRVNPEEFRLETATSLPDGMVRVPGWSTSIDGKQTAFRSFFLGRYEVTNKEFQQFVDAGGYRRPDLWEHEFLIGDRALSFAAAMALFVDSTGRPGPSTWAAGSFLDGQDDYPVAGVSWYEAAAYARFAGRELPTIHHWRRAFAVAILAWELSASNVQQDGIAAVGEFKGIGWTGTYDMLGNVREWCSNAAPERQRVIVGGAWNDAPYLVEESVSTPARRPPMDRSSTNGFRVAQNNDESDVMAMARMPVIDTQTAPLGDAVSDEVFAAKLSAFDYDHSPLHAEIEETVEFRYWVRQRISIDTADGEGRIPIYLYLPKRERSRYQTLVYWPGASSYIFDSVKTTRFPLDFILRNGRAVAMPVVDGMFDRRRPTWPDWTTHNGRDLAIEQVREFRRSIDYLETRPDIAADKLGYAGYSWGGRVGAIVLAVDKRLKVGVLNQAGVNPGDDADINVVNFLPRVEVPVLHFSGRYDTDFRFESSSKPFFDRLGTRNENKKHVVSPTGHFVPPAVVIGETLAWLDRYLGPVD